MMMIVGMARASEESLSRDLFVEFWVGHMYD